MPKSPNHLLLLLALAASGFACVIAPQRSRDRLDIDKQPFASSTTVVIPISLEPRTAGGVEGTLLRVTTLAGNGPGSLCAALEDPRPRLVVFEVGGVIDLQGRSIDVRSPWLTVAGQTAPEPGITLIRGSLSVETHDVIIQHLAVRPGDGTGCGIGCGSNPAVARSRGLAVAESRGPEFSEAQGLEVPLRDRETAQSGEPAKTEWAPDALGAHRGNAGPVHHVVFDHCSATWAIDENLSASGPRDVDPGNDPEITSHDITLRSCLIAEGLSHATHPKGEHSKGTLIHDGVRNVVIAGCLYAHNVERNPRLKGGTKSIVAGNVMYDWKGACVGVGRQGNRQTLQASEAVLVGNVAIAGVDTRSRFFVKSVDPGGRVFLLNNLALAADGTPIALTDKDVAPLPEPANVPDVHPWDAAAHVLRSAGSRPAHRDPIDARIVRSVIEGSGKIIDSQEQVGGYPVRAATTRALTVPDGVDARRKWLDALSRALEEDRTLDLAPLWKRLGRR